MTFACSYDHTNIGTSAKRILPTIWSSPSFPDFVVQLLYGDDTQKKRTEPKNPLGSFV